MKFVYNFFRFLSEARIQSKFFLPDGRQEIPRFCAYGAMAKGDNY